MRSPGSPQGLRSPREGDSNEICQTKILWTRFQGAIVSSLTEMSLADLTAANLRANGRVAAIA